MFLEASKAALRLLETYENQETNTTTHTCSDDVFMNLSSCLIQSIRCSNNIFKQECLFEGENSSVDLLPMPNDAVLDNLLYSLVDDIEINSDTNTKNIKKNVKDSLKIRFDGRLCGIDSSNDTILSRYGIMALVYSYKSNILSLMSLLTLNEENLNFSKLLF